jgi:hypothetical protein
MKDLEDSLDEILEKDIQTMRERVGQSVDVDIFFNMFASGQYFVHASSLGLMDYKLSLNSNFWQIKTHGRGKQGRRIHSRHPQRLEVHARSWLLPYRAQDDHLVAHQGASTAWLGEKFRSLLTFVARDRFSSAHAVNPFAVNHFPSQKIPDTSPLTQPHSSPSQKSQTHSPSSPRSLTPSIPIPPT